MAAYLRLGDVIYPNARKIDYNYAAGVDYIMSRLSFISEQDGTVDAAYQYLGLDTIAVEDYPQAGIELACTFDRFGRVEYQAWEPDSGSGSILDQIAYVRDRDGNVTSALEETAGNAAAIAGDGLGLDPVLLRRARPGEQLHPAALRRDGRDEHVGLVAVRLAGQQHPAKHRRQLQRRQRGNDDQQRRAPAQLRPCRQHADVEQRRHGGLRRLGRLVEVDGTSGTVEQCEYDGTGRRVQVATPTTVETDYYSGQQVIQSDTAVTGSGTTRYQWIWSPRYIDAPICRDTLDSNGNVESPTTGSTTSATPTTTSRPWCNTTRPPAVASCRALHLRSIRHRDDLQARLERDADILVGQQHDLVRRGDLRRPTGLYFDSARYYDPTMGRFISQDPIGITMREQSV